MTSLLGALVDAWLSMRSDRPEALHEGSGVAARAEEQIEDRDVVLERRMRLLVLAVPVVVEVLELDPRVLEQPLVEVVPSPRPAHVDVGFGFDAQADDAL